MIPRRLLTIIEESGVSETLAAAIADDPRVEDVFEALKWRIARQPDIGTLVQHEGVDYRVVYFNPLKAVKNPYVLARYRVDETGEQIVIDWIKVYPYDDNLGYRNPAFDINA